MSKAAASDLAKEGGSDWLQNEVDRFHSDKSKLSRWTSTSSSWSNGYRSEKNLGGSEKQSRKTK